jgi:hypothetical protein
MKVLGRALVLAIALIALLGCETRTDKSDSGGVVLTVSNFNGLPVSIEISAARLDPTGVIAIGNLTINSIVADPTGTSGPLMDVELESYEVIFTRLDGGTRTPPPYRRGIFGNVPANGTFAINGLPMAGSEQVLNLPLSDLLVENGGIDTETGADVITCNLRLRFFGKTIAGKNVDTKPVDFSIEFRQ